MTPQEVADQLLAAHGAADFAAQIKSFQPYLELETVAALKRRVDEERMRNPQRALGMATATQEIAAALAVPDAQALALWARGNALHDLCRYGEALHCFQQAQTLYGRGTARMEVMVLHLNQVAVLKEMGRYAEALTLAQEARLAFEALGTPAQRYLALLEMNVGSAYRQMGQPEAALGAYERGRAIFVAQGDPVATARMDINRANVLEEMDRFAAAEALLLDARAALAVAGRDHEVARADLNLGMLAYRRGNYQAALHALEAAHNGFAAIPNPSEVALVSLHRAFVYRDLNLLEETITLAAEAEATFKRDRTRWQQSQALMIQAAGYQRLGAHGMAAGLLARARRQVRAQGAHNRLLPLDLERARLALAEGHVAQARRMAKRVAGTITPEGWPALAGEAALLLARCALAGAPPDPRLAHAQATLAETVAERYHLPELQVAAHHLMALSAEASGESAEALRHVSAALRAIEAQRVRLPLDEFQTGFLDDKLPIYATALRLARHHASPSQLLSLLNLALTAPLPALPHEAAGAGATLLATQLDALRERWHWVQSKLEGATLLEADTAPSAAPEEEARWREQLRALEREIAELRRRWQVRATAEPLAQPRAEALLDPAAAEGFAGAIAGALGAGERLVHFFVSGDQMEALVVTPEGPHLAGALAPVASLHRLLRAWRLALEQANLLPEKPEMGSARVRPHLSRFYQALIQPLAPLLVGASRLLIVLPPGWHDLPIAAFHDGRGWLAERFTIEHLSAPEALLAPTPPPARSGRALVLGYSDGGRLPHAVAEAERIAATLAPSLEVTCLVEAEATLAALRAASEESTLIHLATHAIFRPDNPFFSWMRLADTHLTVADLYERPLPRRPLVVLSACETGRGLARGGGLLGMARGFLAAGAGSLVVSLWKVADEATASLMGDFYHALVHSGSLTPAEALQHAQQRAISQGQPPFGWGSFISIRR